MRTSCRCIAFLQLQGTPYLGVHQTGSRPPLRQLWHRTSCLPDLGRSASACSGPLLIAAVIPSEAAFSTNSVQTPAQDGVWAGAGGCFLVCGVEPRMSRLGPPKRWNALTPTPSPRGPLRPRLTPWPVLGATATLQSSGDLALLEEAMTDERACALLLGLGEQPKGAGEMREIVLRLRDLRRVRRDPTKDLGTHLLQALDHQRIGHAPLNRRARQPEQTPPWCTCYLRPSCSTGESSAHRPKPAWPASPISRASTTPDACTRPSAIAHPSATRSNTTQCSSSLDQQNPKTVHPSGVAPPGPRPAWRRSARVSRAQPAPGDGGRWSPVTRPRSA